MSQSSQSVRQQQYQQLHGQGSQQQLATNRQQKYRKQRQQERYQQQQLARRVDDYTAKLISNIRQIGPASFKELFQHDMLFRSLFPDSLINYGFANDIRRADVIGGVITLVSDDQGHARVNFVGSYNSNYISEDSDEPPTKVVIQADFISQASGGYMMSGGLCFIEYDQDYDTNIFSIDQALLVGGEVMSTIRISVDELILCPQAKLELWTPLYFRTSADSLGTDIMTKILNAHPELRPDFICQAGQRLSTGGLQQPNDTWRQKILKVTNLASRVSIH